MGWMGWMGSEGTKKVPWLSVWLSEVATVITIDSESGEYAGVSSAPGRIRTFDLGIKSAHQGLMVDGDRCKMVSICAACSTLLGLVVTSGDGGLWVVR